MRKLCKAVVYFQVFKQNMKLNANVVKKGFQSFEFFSQQIASILLVVSVATSPSLLCFTMVSQAIWMHCLQSWELVAGWTYFHFHIAGFVLFFCSFFLWYPKHSQTLFYRYHAPDVHKYPWNFYRYVLNQTDRSPTIISSSEMRNIHNVICYLCS